MIYEVGDDIARIFFTLWRLSDPADWDMSFPWGGIVKCSSASVTSLFFEKLHHFSRVWTHLSWSWKHEGMFSLPLQRVAKGEMRGKWLECLPQCKHQIAGAWPELIRSETAKKSSLFDYLEGMRVTSQHPFWPFSIVRAYFCCKRIPALSRESKQSCLTVPKNANTSFRPCFVSRADAI